MMGPLEGRHRKNMMAVHEYGPRGSLVGSSSGSKNLLRVRTEPLDPKLGKPLRRTQFVIGLRKYVP